MPGSHTLSYSSDKLEESYSRGRKSSDYTENDPDDPTTHLLPPQRERNQHNGPTYQSDKLEKKKGFLYKIREDRKYRQQLFSTFWIWFGFMMFGWVYGQIGTTLPDLQMILGVSLDTASWLFTSFSFGYMVGCLLGGTLIGRINSFLLMSVYCTAGAGLVIAIPWCPELWLMILVRALHGFCIGGMDTTGHAEVFAIWKLDSAVYIQFLYLFFALGGILSPFATNPFLAKDLVQNETTSGNGSGSINSTIMSSLDLPEDTAVKYGETLVHYAFIISGILTSFSAIGFFAEFLKTRNINRHGKSKQKADGIDLRKKPPKALFILSMIIMTLLLLIATGWIDTFGGYLMSFSLYHFQWTKDTGALLTSLFWVSFAVGNLICIFLVLYLKTTVVILLYVSGSVVALTGLLFSSLFLMNELTWFFIMLTGFSMSALWPAFFTWTEETVTAVSGNVASMFLVSGSIGLMLNPLAAGNLMDAFTPMWFVYLLIIESVALLVLFVSVVLIYHFTKSPSVVVVDVKRPRVSRSMSKSGSLL